MLHDYVFATDSIRFIMGVTVVVKNSWHGDIRLCLHLCQGLSVKVSSKK